MFWEEKIDKLKKEVGSDDFRVPFTDGSAILKKIEDKFIFKANPDGSFSKWADSLKAKQKIGEVKASDLDYELMKLNPDQNYWIILGDSAATKRLIYDSRPHVILKLLQLRDGDFCIGDKKYNWFACFKCSPSDVVIFKSGEKQTPWDKK